MKRQLLAIAMAAMLVIPSVVRGDTGGPYAGSESVTPISIASIQELSFGHVARGATPGSATVSPTGTRSAAGGVTLTWVGTACSQAVFVVTGEPNASFAISLPDSVSLTSGADSMTLDTFASSPSGTLALGGGGNSTLYVGATLHIGANQADGDYTGRFDVIVNYN